MKRMLGLLSAASALLEPASRASGVATVVASA
jgi:hypothetical protein